MEGARSVAAAASIRTAPRVLGSSRDRFSRVMRGPLADPARALDLSSYDRAPCLAAPPPTSIPCGRRSGRSSRRRSRRRRSSSGSNRFGLAVSATAPWSSRRPPPAGPGSSGATAISSSARRAHAMRASSASPWRIPRARSPPRRRSSRSGPTRSIRSTASSSGRGTGWPTPPRSPSPSSPARRTTRSSSTARPGLGKTHLLGAIAGYLAEQRPDLAVHCTTAERFTTEFVTCLREDGPAEFKRRHRDVDALLIDDVQALEGKPRTEEEFVDTFNALHRAGKQIVLSSDRPPEALEHLAERLRDRFHWGLTRRARSRLTSEPGSRSCGG